MKLALNQIQWIEQKLLTNPQFLAIARSMGFPQTLQQDNANLTVLTNQQLSFLQMFIEFAKTNPEKAKNMAECFGEFYLFLQNEADKNKPS